MPQNVEVGRLVFAGASMICAVVNLGRVTIEQHAIIANSYLFFGASQLCLTSSLALSLFLSATLSVIEDVIL